MLDTKRLLDQFLGAGQNDGTGQSDRTGALGRAIGDPGSFAKGAAAGGLAGLLLGGKKPKKIAKTALQAGGVALIGGLAYKAWRDWQSGQAPAETKTAPAQTIPTQTIPTQTIPAPPQDSPFLPAAATEQQKLGRKLIQAMVAAARADGHIDADENRRISDRLSQLNLDADDLAFLNAEIKGTTTVDDIAARVDCPEQAAEIYLAAVLVVDENGLTERTFLNMLAQRLSLDPALMRHLEAAARDAETA